MLASAGRCRFRRFPRAGPGPASTPVGSSAPNDNRCRCVPSRTSPEKAAPRPPVSLCAPGCSPLLSWEFLRLSRLADGRVRQQLNALKRTTCPDFSRRTFLRSLGIASLNAALPPFGLWRTPDSGFPPRSARSHVATPRVGPFFEQIPNSANCISWVHVNGRSPEMYLPETVGAGCAFVDYDNDGWMDIYLVNSGDCDFYHPNPPLRNALYRNNRAGPSRTSP